MWLSHNVCKVVSMFVTFCAVLAIGAEESKDLSRGTSLVPRGVVAEYSSKLYLRLLLTSQKLYALLVAVM